MSEHLCHAKGCRTPVAPELLMCKRHWKMVPFVIKRAVNRYYVPGQCDLNPMPSLQWHGAATAAINAVADLEGR